MAFRIKPSSIYVKSKKVGMAKNGKLSIKSNDERQVGDGGYKGHSDGVETCDMSFDAIVSVSGETAPIVDILKNKEYVKIHAGVLDGGIYEVEGRIMGVDYDWDHEKGTCMGAFTIEGGTAKRIDSLWPKLLPY